MWALNVEAVARLEVGGASAGGGQGGVSERKGESQRQGRQTGGNESKNYQKMDSAEQDDTSATRKADEASMILKTKFTKLLCRSFCSEHFVKVSVWFSFPKTTEC